MADYDWDRAQHIVRSWPIREVLHTLGSRVRARELERYRFEFLRWAPLAPWSKEIKQPKVPDALREGEADDDAGG